MNKNTLSAFLICMIFGLGINAQEAPVIKEFSLPDPIYWIKLSSDGKYLIACTDLDEKYDKGVVYRVSDGLKSHELKFDRRGKASFADDRIIDIGEGYINIYDITTGNRILSLGKEPLLSSTSRGYSMSIVESDSYVRILAHNDKNLIVTGQGYYQGISLKDGSTLWNNAIKPNSRIGIIENIDDDNHVILQIDKTLYLLDTTTGKTRLLPNVSGLSSQVLLCDEHYYMADYRNLLCFDKELNPVWSTPLKKSEMARSHLYMLGDTLVLINTGNLNDTQLKAKGLPFVATYNAANGTQQHKTQLSKKKESFYQLWATDGMAIARSNKNLAKVDLENGELSFMQYKPLDINQIANLSWGEYYIFGTEGFEQIGMGYEGVITRQFTAYRLSETAEPQPVSDKSRPLYVRHDVLENGLLCLTNPLMDIWIVTPQGEFVYNFTSSLSSTCQIDGLEGNSLLFHTPNGKYKVAVFDSDSRITIKPPKVLQLNQVNGF